MSYPRLTTQTEDSNAMKNTTKGVRLKNEKCVKIMENKPGGGNTGRVKVKKRKKKG